ncbi:MAG: HsdM family class I SAM-dependent methyltransferase [Promethearchaeota archaeon]
MEQTGTGTEFTRVDGEALRVAFGRESAPFRELFRSVSGRVERGGGDIGAAFSRWVDWLGGVYPREDLTRELFSTHAYLYLLARALLYRTSPDLVGVVDSGLAGSFFNWTAGIPGATSLCAEAMGGGPLEPGDLFSGLYQGFFHPFSRHILGEFYTPRVLAREMVLEVLGGETAAVTSPGPGDYVLDPACGTGAFLVEVYRHFLDQLAGKPAANDPRVLEGILSSVVGFDVNPLAVACCRANLAILAYLKAGFRHTPRVYLYNPLFPDEEPGGDVEMGSREFDPRELAGRVALAVGNPPWLVVNRIPGEVQKDSVKALGAEYGIFQGGQTATSTEATTVFVHKVLADYLRDGGTLFFVTPASLLTGSQHDRFRYFRGMRDVEFWDFDRDLFRIHSTCFLARKGTEPDSTRLRPKVTTFHCSVGEGGLLGLERGGVERYRPAHVKFERGTPRVGRLNPEGEVLDVEWKPSHYRSRFYQGASLVPRNLVLVDATPGPRPGTSRIRPAAGMVRKKDARWDFTPYEEAVVESRFVFPVAKSSNLLPFRLHRLERAFLPVVVDGEGYRFATGGEMSRGTAAHLELLEDTYERHRKPEARVKTYRDRLDFHRYLTTPLQRSPLRVVYNGVGSRVKAAILDDPRVVVDTSLYQCAADSWSEAYYLLGILNSPVVTRVAELTGSSGAGGSLRNIHQYPLSVYFRAYSGTPAEEGVAALAREVESVVGSFVGDPGLAGLGPRAVQNRLVADGHFSAALDDLDVLVRKLLSGKS